ncbi:hypothetical protein SAMN05444156_2770 [Verrucomicrobium sp. GAS474]|uniref:hypothetical protein n=1 Tax=Verrucomicrobium sp. GAS474 TaxID=1882831 RepID=UPI00087B5CCD|nr:hypothetical protein [Verrucomicrobium sp. GAS474]SDU23541.1 hypothetical protein SAMN05444156_2770 [Verrucomicrobium sp. GAS474]
MASLRLIVSFVFLPVCAWATGGGYDAAPPVLPYYLARLPAKSIGQIYQETFSPVPRSDYDGFSLYRESDTEAFAKGTSPELTERIAGAIRARRSWGGGASELNLLQDFYDLSLSRTIPGPEMAAYVRWRKANEVESLSHSQWEPKLIPPGRIAEAMKLAEASSPEMRPHWDYVVGAFYFKGGNDTDSERYFDQVLAEAPQHPRAEAALFMKARCHFSQTVYGDRLTLQVKEAKRAETEALFKRYLKAYPKGRYRADALGWLGGLAYEFRHCSEAVGYFLHQTEDRDHPEDFAPAVTMIEKSLVRMSYRANTTGGIDEEIYGAAEPSPDYDALASQPRVALAVAYLILNTAPKDPDSYRRDGTSLRQQAEGAEAWRQTALARLAKAVAAHRKDYVGEAWQDRSLAILAYAASDGGDQKQALTLVAMAGKKAPARSDDLAFARALILHRAGDLEAATQAWRDFLRAFPRSPLWGGARLRYALVLHDRKQDGEALLELAALNGNRLPVRSGLGGTVTTPPASVSQIGLDYSGASYAEVAQALDALLNFAPIESLEPVLQNTDPALENLRNDLCAVLRQRALARDDFRMAARFEGYAGKRRELEERAAKQEHLTAKAGATASGAWEMADWWRTRRKQALPFPLDGTECRGILFDGEGAGAGSLRLQNGQALGFPAATMQAELDGREELLHAVRWWRKTEEIDPKGELTPKALWAEIDAARRIASVSPYTLGRAVENGSIEGTRPLYDRLLSLYPASAEAKRAAVYWSLPLEGMKSGSFFVTSDVDLDSRRVNGRSTYTETQWDLSRPGRDNRSGDGTDGKEYRRRLEALPEKALSLDAEAFQRELKGLRERAPAAFHEVNLLDDLLLLSRVPKLDRAIVAEYVRARLLLLRRSDDGWYGERLDAGTCLAAVDALEAKKGAAPIRDFTAFLRLAITASVRIDLEAKGVDKNGAPLTYAGCDYPALMREASAFLAAYPSSPKREAAALLRLRGLILGSRLQQVGIDLAWPAGDHWDWTASRRFWRASPFDSPAVEAAFRDYEREFPAPTFPNALISLRAEAALSRQDWAGALGYADALLRQETAPELWSEAAGQLGWIFDKLDDEALRWQVLPLILRNPAFKEDLTAYLASGHLPWIKGYLKGKLGG